MSEPTGVIHHPDAVTEMAPAYAFPPESLTIRAETWYEWCVWFVVQLARRNQRQYRVHREIDENGITYCCVVKDRLK